MSPPQTPAQSIVLSIHSPVAGVELQQEPKSKPKSSPQISSIKVHYVEIQVSPTDSS